MTAPIIKLPIKKNVVKLGPNEEIIAVVPELAHGPGYEVRMAFIHVVDTLTYKWRHIPLRPENQSDTLQALWDVGRVAHESLRGSLEIDREEPKE